MEDEIQKRNTDCVYFLASPLTCKKGIECEYRHSESARLNPRDCWYWLAGNCLNPTCAFRHPPLDGRPETSSEPAALPQQLSVPMTKANVPCYYYFNGFCNKGDKCSFLHGPNSISPTLKSSRTASTLTDVHPLENKTSTGSDTGPASAEAPPNPSGTTTKAVMNVQFQTKEDFQPSVFSNVVERSPSPQISMFECEEAAVKSDTLLPAEDFVDTRSPPCLDQSSEEAVDDHIEPEEWWESSPGLDVLVDDGSENLGYMDDPEYLLVREREARGFHNHLLPYDYEDPVGYDPMEYPDAGILYEHGIYGSNDHLENDHASDYVRRVPEHSMERMLDPMLSQKRKFLHRELEVNGRNSMDLRDHLRKRRRIDSHQASRKPRRRGSSRLNDRSQERPRRHGRGHPLHGKLASEVGKNMVGSHREKDSELNGSHQGSWLRHSETRRNRSRQHEKERRQARSHFLSSEVSRGPAPRATKPTQESSTFTGPKTLAQIKEEKRKARANEDGFGDTGCQSRTMSEDLEGPKPLSGILQDKGRLGSVSDDNTSKRSKRDRVEHERNHGHFDNDENNFVDEEDEDDEGLEKKLGSIFS